MTTAENTRKLEKLKTRIKYTSSIRFAASKRIRFNYSLAKLTVVILSLWSIFISYVLTSELNAGLSFEKEYLESLGVILPVFVVVFSLIEGGETYLRAHLLELNARQLRELADKLAGRVASANGNAAEYADIYEKISLKYNDILERSPINHDDIDHLGKHYIEQRQSARSANNEKKDRFLWVYYSCWSVGLWGRRQAQRILYVLLWIIPLIVFFVDAEERAVCEIPAPAEDGTNSCITLPQ